MKTFPQWLKRPMPVEAVDSMNTLLEEHRLNTVCRSARCPNIGECFQKKQATFMILGNVCTRNCRFCSVKNGIPEMLDLSEPFRIAWAVKELGMEYAIITSVTRDDLHDGGADQFANTIETVRKLNPDVKIEVLTPDFNSDFSSLNTIKEARPDVFAHNIETIPRLYRRVRPNATFENSLSVLKFIRRNSGFLVKSGFMLGLGEEDEEVIELLRTLRNINLDIITIGQYLRPDESCLPVKEFVIPKKFDYFKEKALEIGMPYVESGPFVRSSYKAKVAYEEVRRWRSRFPS